MFKQCILFFEFLAVNSIMKVFGAIFILGKLHWKLNVFFYQRTPSGCSTSIPRPLSVAPIAAAAARMRTPRGARMCRKRRWTISRWIW